MKTMNKDPKIDRTPPEFRLMLLCSGKSMSEAQIAEVQAILSEGVDWKVFMTLLDKHRMIPVVFDNLKVFFKDETETPGLRRLGFFRKQCMARSMRIASAWVSINAAMNEADVRVIHLKGPALSLRIYGDIDLRISKDLDLLVDTVDIERADRVLKDVGYTRQIPASDMTPRQKELWFKNNHHYSYLGPNAMNIELHFRLSLFLYEISFDELWAKRRTDRYGGTEYAYLSPEEELLFCAYHGAKHGWSRMRWLLDVNELIRIGAADPGRLAELAGERRLTRVLSQAFILCERFYRTEISADLLAAGGKAGSGRRLAEMAIPMIMAPEDGIGTLMDRLVFGTWEKSIRKARGLDRDDPR